jgi:AcrR family transcriptional regulator
LRVKTDARRNTILAAAWDVFKAGGFDKASMDEIALKANCSKATLYSYFKSKQELFGSALEFALSDRSQEPFNLLTAPGAIADRLQSFARAHLEDRLSPDMIAVDRIVFEAAEHPGVYEMLKGKSRGRRKRIAEVLQVEMDAGRLRQAEPIRAAIHLIALIEFDLADRWLYGDKRITRAMIDEQVRLGVEAFMRAYAPA